MAVIVLAFAISIAIATFVENDFGSQSARSIIYNAWWFNALLFLGIINLTGTIIMGRLYTKRKFTIFLFHLAFLFILGGAAITRFFGFEGIMHIRTGDSSNTIVSSSNYLTISAISGEERLTREKQVYLSPITDNFRTIRLNTGKNIIKATCIEYIQGAVEKIADVTGGKPMIEIVVSSEKGRLSYIVSENEPVKIGKVLFTFNDSSNTDGVNIISSGKDELMIYSGIAGTVMRMSDQQTDTVTAGKTSSLKIRQLYKLGGIMLVPSMFSNSGKREVSAGDKESRDLLPDALIINVTFGNETKTIKYIAYKDRINTPKTIKLNGASVSVSYGPKVIQLPFSLGLNRFILERYPGSNSPSWFESRVTLTDQKSSINEQKRVYMNNVLKYNGYRFYQSSYDTDEMGTIFSVNHDAGTWVTYTGYLMLATGIILSLFNRNSRFGKLSNALSQLRMSTVKSALLLITGIFLFEHTSAAVLPDNSQVDKDHARRFGTLLIQDPAGRIKPVNTLSSELLRKVSGKTTFMEQDPDQVLLGMLAYPEYWQHIAMIRVSHPEIQKILNIPGRYVSFSGVFDINEENVPYRLSQYVSNAYQKKPANRNTFDNEIIRLDERVNLCYQVYSGNFLRIFPKPGDESGTWYSPSNFQGHFKGNDSIFVSSIIPLYMQSLNESTAGKMTVPDEALTALHNFQIAYGKNLIPGEFKVRLEILNNRLNLFDRLGSAYGLAGFILLILLFMTIFIPRLNLRPYTKAFVWIIGLFFIIHFLGLIARWIISGHAPWSNGYESLIYIAFATVLAGLILSHKSTITLSVTAILAWLILFVAHLNWMDPQITNLVPVLKSYWLLIHVAVITASYGFLAMGAVMAFLNLILMIAQTKGNHIRTHQIITEFSLVIEMTLIIGLYLLTIGTFLGGVWANESWGRYWGWDPKETWALVSVLIYAFVAHMRLVPGLKGNYLFNLMSLLAFSSIIMTYFGVNYYLSGLHSYAKGDPLPVPSFVYYALAIIGLVALLAWENQRRMKLLEVDAPEQGLISSGTKFRKPNSTITVVDHVDDL
jgi:cytochrome c-type biogenesis protein CcsB